LEDLIAVGRLFHVLTAAIGKLAGADGRAVNECVVFFVGFA